MSAASTNLLQREYEKNPNIKPSDIQEIRNWLTLQPHLPGEYITDIELILAFHCCDCCSERTKNVIDLNYTLRTMCTFYQQRDLDDTIEGALRTWLITPLQATTKKGYRAIYCQLLDPDPQNFVYGDVVKTFVMIVDLWLSEEGTAPGTVIILNMEGVSAGHLSIIDLVVAQQFFYFLQEAMFVRLKEFHFINAPSFMDIIMSMMGPFMKKDLLEMLHIHQAGSASLQDYIPVEVLPKDSKEGMVLKEKIWTKLHENQLFFEEEMNKRVNESKRPSGPLNVGTFFSGLEQSFKKLEID